MPNPLRTLTDTQLAERLAGFAEYLDRPDVEFTDRSGCSNANGDHVAEAARRLRVLAGLREWLEDKHKRVENCELVANGASAVAVTLAGTLAELDRRLAEGQGD